MPKENIFSDNNLGSFIENRYGDRLLYSINGSSFDQIGAHAVYHNMWGQDLFKENTLYVLAGTDSGLLPRYIERIGIPEGSRYLFIELEEVLPYVADCFDKEQTENKKLVLTTAAEWFETAQSLSLTEYAYLDAVQLIASVAASDAHLVAYSEFWRELEKEMQRVIWRYQKEFGTLTFITRHIENLAENRTSASVLSNTFRGKTAVLMAGGPSLDSLLPWIKENRNRICLLAVSRISKRLLDVDIIPDIIVTVDPHYCSYEVSRHMLRFTSSVLVNAYHATPLLLSQWPGRSLYLDHRYPWKKDAGVVVQGRGPTVSNSAINLCIAMGFEQIILAGLDLCFSQEGYSHAEGSIERSKGAFVAYGTQTVTTNDGNIAETDTSFYNSVSVIEEQAKIAISNGSKVINPAGSAARMKNVEYITTDNIALPDGDYHAIDIINAHLPEENSEQLAALYQQTLKELNRVEHQISKLKNYAKDALKCNDGLFGRNGLKKSFKYKVKMDRIEKKIAKEIPEIASIAKIFGMADFVKTLRPDESRQWTDEEIENTGKQFYNAYIHGANKLTDVISDTAIRLRTRMDEEKPHPNIESLCETWQREHVPGRALNWIERHGDNYQNLSTANRERLNSLIKQFNNLIDSDQTSHQITVQRYADLRPTISKLQNLMFREDVPAMRRLLLGLTTRPEDEAKHLAKLVDAHIAECEQNMQEAIEAYRQIIDLDVNVYPRLIEVALIRLSILSMNCGEIGLAAECLKNLTGLSFAYMPYYAEALRLSDQLQQAIDVYTGYLSKVPDDLASMMKLGIIYKNIGVKEGAAWLFDYVYKRDPNNKAAWKMLQELELSA